MASEGCLALSSFFPCYLGVISVVSDAETGLSKRPLGLDTQTMSILVGIGELKMSARILRSL